MSLPIRVAVLGSCVTRDVFNRRFNPSYKDLFECVLLSNQVSIISLMDEPVPFPDDALSDIGPAGQAEIRAELSRSFLPAVAAAQPEYLIVDLFADVHFGCAQRGERIVTRNRWKITQTAFYEQEPITEIPPDSDDYFERWTDAVDRFFSYLRDVCPDTKVVLHEARNVSRWRDDAGELHDLPRPELIARMNDNWQRLDAYIRGTYADDVISIFTSDTVSFEGHPWKRYWVHYTFDYHAAFLVKLAAIALADARAAGPRPNRATSRLNALRGRGRIRS